MSNKSKILVVRFGQLGDLLLSTGVLKFYGREYGWKFDFLTSNSLAEIYQGHPYINRVISCSNHELNGRPLFKFLRKLSKEYRKEDVLIDLHGTLRSSVLRFFWPGKVYAYNKHSLERRLFVKTRGYGKGTLLKSNVPQRYSSAFAKYIHANKLESLDFEANNKSEDFTHEKRERTLISLKNPYQLSPEELKPYIKLSQEELEEAENRLSKLGIKKPVALHPFATHETKTWTEKRWKELSLALREKEIEHIFIGVGNSSFNESQESFINKTSLRQSAALLAHCKALITGDSGPMHLARAVQTKVVALYGPTTKEWGFFPSPSEGIVLEKDLDCRPCSLHGVASCPIAQKCLRDIQIDEVLKALSKYL